ncbi:hypothetical protein [uncultured Gemella sp.]|uniref:hypothetical protein n=1 Tax=uncultured Gemella sp. TaxID=254352 RepID=UPI0028D7CE02|nr:hypothetical protein [uncultured Gemella sp.]
MKLNKFLVAAAAVAVLPLSVANAEEPTSSNVPADAPVLQPEPAPRAIVNDKGELLGTTDTLPAPTVEKPEFTGGVNGPSLVQPELKPYGASLVAPEVHTKPEYKAPKSQGTFKVDKGTEAGKAQNGQKVLPKTSAVK